MLNLKITGTTICISIALKSLENDTNMLDRNETFYQINPSSKPNTQDNCERRASRNNREATTRSKINISI